MCKLIIKSADNIEPHHHPEGRQRHWGEANMPKGFYKTWIWFIGWNIMTCTAALIFLSILYLPTRCAQAAPEAEDVRLREAADIWRQNLFYRILNSALDTMVTIVKQVPKHSLMSTSLKLTQINPQASPEPRADISSCVSFMHFILNIEHQLPS